MRDGVIFREERGMLNMNRGTDVETQYEKLAKAFRALSDPKRVRIIDLLSCGELCACVLLKCFEITQPTLSHDMRVLIEADLVRSRRDGKRIYYSLNEDFFRELNIKMQEICRKDSGKGKTPCC